MKKVFLSVPMRGRTKENIEDSLRKMREIVAIALGKDVEFINTIVKEKSPEGSNESIWYLGESIKLLSQADIFVGVDVPYWMGNNGTRLESDIWTSYKNSFEEHNFIKIPLDLVMTSDEIFELYHKYLDEENIEKINAIKA